MGRRGRGPVTAAHRKCHEGGHTEEVALLQGAATVRHPPKPSGSDRGGGGVQWRLELAENHAKIQHSVTSVSSR